MRNPSPTYPQSIFLPRSASPGNLGGRVFISGFQEIFPRFRSSQKELLEWLVDAHAVLGQSDRETMRSLFSRYGGASGAVAYRHHELPDFTHRVWESMRLFHPRGSNVAEKGRFYNDAAVAAIERFYPAGTVPPAALVHVTCTGYNAPSAAQKLVSARGWGRQTQVLHAYHMGCYAAHPALQIAAGLTALSPDAPVDVIHTELCSLHLDPTLHDPGQLVIQSLFADGHIQYRVGGAPARDGSSLEILALHDEILPDSAQAMDWSPGPSVFVMALSKEVPTLLAGALPGFARRLFEKAQLDFNKEKEKAAFAIHPGGPRIIELAEKLLQLAPEQAAASHQVLRERGNMSSATLPTIWQAMLRDDRLADGTVIVSLGAGPGLTLSGALFRIRR